MGLLSGGETGAHEVRGGPDAERIVLKWETDPDSQTLRREGVELTERLRTEAGWPVPQQRTSRPRVACSCCSLLCPDTRSASSRPEWRTSCSRLHGRRLDLGEDGAGDRWAQRLVRTLVEGGRTYCLHESLRGYDARTAALVEEIEAFGARVDPEDFRARDIIHWDFHLGNLLAQEGRLSAVVDTDFCAIGDAAFDLVALALSSSTVTCASGLRRHLFRLALEPLPSVRRTAYLGHLFIRVLDWPIRRGSDVEVEHWLAQVARCRGAGYF